MTMESATLFLVGSVLIGSGFIVLSLAALAINNLFARYWKPVKLAMYSPVEYKFIDTKTLQEVVPVNLDQANKVKQTKS